MRYNEYIASEGKVLLNINDFAFANRMITKNDLELIELSKEEAEYYYNKYQEELAKQQEDTETEELVEEVVEEPVEEEPVLLKGAKGLRTTAADVEPADPVQRLKNLLKEEMVFNGYNLNNLVEPIIHELK